MPRNVEIKASIGNIEAFEGIAASISTSGPFVVTHDDIYFRCGAGRLKLRRISSASSELIFYRRCNRRQPTESFYSSCAIQNPNDLEALLNLALGVVGRVAKTRVIYLVGRTRLHLDRVQGLGTYLELEAMLEPDEPTKSGVRRVYELLNRLDVVRAQLVTGSYLDLLARGGV